VQEEELTAFLKETVELFDRCRNGFDTQMCESFNAVKPKFATKETSWRLSWPARVMCAVLQMNSEENWRVALAEVCGIEMSAQVVERLTAKWQKEQKRKQKRRTPEALLKACRLRWEPRRADKKATVGKNDYRRSAAPQPDDDPEDDDSDEELILYSEALERDPLIAVPAEPGDDSVLLVRNEEDTFRTELPAASRRRGAARRAPARPAPARRQPARPRAAPPAPGLSAPGLPAPARLALARAAAADTAPNPFSIFGASWGYTPPAIDRTPRPFSLGPVVPPDFSHPFPARVPLPSDDSSDEEDLCRKRPPPRVEHEDELDDTDDEDIDADDGIGDLLPAGHSIPNDYWENGFLDGKTLVIVAKEPIL
jgi:hypothetical protein